jgi:dTDP-4-dehydrorhamnose reductase
MLGHKLCDAYRTRYDTWAAARRDYDRCSEYGLYDPDRYIGGLDASDAETFRRAIDVAEPNVVVNCVGIIKQAREASSPIPSIEVNSLLPHRLAELCAPAGARLIHISTDCVFSGRKGMYTEQDQSDAEDLYGRTKFLGEVSQEGCLTLRTSIIGRELSTSYGLVEWFLSNRSRTVKGYTHAVFTGFTTAALADIIARVIDDFPSLSGLYQVSSDPISKHDLLCLIRDAFRTPIIIEPADAVRIDRSLDSSRFRAETGFVPPSWPCMVQEMGRDKMPYDLWRR